MKPVFGPKEKSSKTITHRKPQRRGAAKLAKAIRPAVEELELRQMLSGGQSPVAVLHGPYNVNEGESIIIDGADSTDSDGTIVSYKWDFNYNPANGFHTQGTGNPVAFEGDDGPASQTIALRVTDNDGNVNTTTATINTVNVAPEITLTGNDSVAEAGTYTLGWSATDAAADTISGWDINWGDGTAHTTVAGNISSANHVFNDHGTPTITVTATDEDGSYQATKQITVTTVVPIVSLSGNPTVNEGTSYHINFSSTDPGGDTRSGWVIDWGDGTVIATGASATTRVHTYTNNGSYTIKVTALATDGDEGFATLGVSVLNVAPTAGITSAPSGSSPEGTAITVGSTATDPSGDSLTRTWSVIKDDEPYALPNGTNTSGSSFTFTPRDNGSYVIRLSVFDGTDTTTTDTEAFDVFNVDPTGSIGGAPVDPITEGDQVDLSVTPADAGTDDSFSYSWSVSKGEEAFALPEETDTTSANFSFVPTDNGTYVATVVITDDDNGDVTVSTSAIVALNADPTGNITGEPVDPIVEGTPVELGAHAQDAGSADTLTYSWTVKRGGSAYTLPEGLDTTSAAFTFTPRDNGTYVAYCAITDDDEAVITKHSADIVVVNADPTGTISGQPEGPIEEGDLVNLSVTPHDAGVDDTFTYNWSVTRNDDPFPLSDNPEEAEAAEHTSANFSFRVRDQGTYVATCTITDNNDGHVDVSTTDITVNNKAPESGIDQQPEGELDEGDTVNVVSFAFDPAGDVDNITFAWSVTRNDEPYALGQGVNTTGPTLSFVARDNGVYVATCVVTDKDNATSSAATTPIVVNNVDPTGEITGAPEAPIDEGDTVSLSVDPADSGVEDTFTYSWSVTKGEEEFVLPEETNTTSSTFSFVPTDNGSYVATVRITDKDSGFVDVSTDPITVLNVAPEATISGVPDGGTSNLDATISAEGFNTVRNNNTFFSDIVIDAGEFQGRLLAGIMKWQLPEGLTVNDVNDATFTLHTGGAPERQVDLYTFLDTDNSTTVVTGDYADAAAATTVVQSDVLGSSFATVTISGAALTNAIKAALTAGRDHVTFALRLTDNTVQEHNDTGFIYPPTWDTESLRPALTIGTAGAPTVEEGTLTTLTANPTDAGAADTFTYQWSVKRNDEDVPLPVNTSGTSQQFDFVPLGAGSYVVSCVITDDDEQSVTVHTTTINVLNAPPVGSIDFGEIPELTYEGEPLSFSANVSDPGEGELSYAWSVKKNDQDYTLPEGVFTDQRDFTFTPDNDGTYVVTCVVTDADDAESTFNSGPISVLNADPTGSVSGEPEGEISEGTPVELSVSAHDAGNDSIGYTWSVTKDDEPFVLPEELDVNSSEFTFTPTDDGVYVATVRILDADGGLSDVSTGSITVVNADPTGSINGQPSGAVNEGATVSLTAVPHDAGALDTFTYSWQVTKGESNYVLPEETDTSSNAFSFVPRDNGTYVATVTITDKDNGHVDVSTDPITVNNVAPTVSITGLPGESTDDIDATLPSNTANTVDSLGNVSEPDLLQIGQRGESSTMVLSVIKWRLPEGLAADDVQDATLVLHWLGGWSGQVDLYAFDSQSNTVSADDFALATGQNVQPIASAITGNGSEQDVTISNEALTQAIKDAITAGRDHLSLAIIPLDFTPQEIGEDMLGSFAGPDYEVEAQRPELTISTSTPASLVEGSTTTLTAETSDPGVDDTLTYSWTVTKDEDPYSTGETATDQSTFDFSPRDNGDYAITVSVFDGTDTHADTVNITVANANPTGTISGQPEGPINEGDTVSLSAEGSDVGQADVVGLLYSWSVTKDDQPFDLPQGTITNFQNFSFTATDDGTYVAKVTITDKDNGHVDVTTAPITVNNVAPTVTISGAGETTSEGSTTTLTAHGSDAGVDDDLTYSWSVTKDEEAYDTGEVATDQPTFDFIPSDDGNYVVSVTVTDNGDLTGSDSVAIAVENANPTGTISGVPQQEMNEGDTATLTAHPADAGSDDTVFTYAWSVTRNDEPQLNLQEIDGGSPNYDFHPTDNGEYVVTVRITDEDGGFVDVSTDPITVNNVDPAVTITGAPVPGNDVDLTVPQGGGDTVLDNHTIFDNPSAWLIGEWAGQRYTGVLKWSLPEGLTADEVGDATLVFHSYRATTRQVNLYSYDSASSTVSGNDYDPAEAATNLIASDLFTTTDPTTISNEALTQAIKDAITAGRDHVTFAIRQTDTTVHDDDVRALIMGPSYGIESDRPTLTIGAGAGSVLEGSTTTLTASVTDPGVDDTQSYAWTVTRNNQPYDLEGQTTDAITFDFTPNDNGDYVITVTATDKDGGHDTNSVNITVANANPTGEVTGEPEGNVTEGSLINLSVDADDPGSADIAGLTYSWSVSNGESVFNLPQGANTTSRDFSFTPVGAGSYVATVTITDKDSGHVSVSSSAITVINAPPTGTISGQPESAVEGTAINLAVDAHDVGNGELTYSWSVTRGEEAFALPEGTNTTSSEFSFTPTDNGDYLVTCAITDIDDATVNVDSGVIHVANADPSGTVTSDVEGEGSEGTAITFTAHPTDAGAEDTTFTYSWTVHRGEDVFALPEGTNTSSAQLTFTPTDDGIYTASVVVTDKDDADSTLTSDPITVNNVNPGGTVTYNGDSEVPVYEGQELGFTVNPTDAGSEDTFNYSWSVSQFVSDGEGGFIEHQIVEPEAGDTTFTFTPPDQGDYIVRCTVTDDNEGQTTLSSDQLRVNNASPLGEITGMPEGTPVEGTTLNLTMEAHDPGVNDTLTYSWSVTKDEEELVLPEETDTTHANFTFTVPDDGEYMFTCTVTDKDEAPADFHSSVTVVNADPTGTITGEPEGESVEGSSITLTAHGSDAGANESLTYSWAVTKDEQEYPLGEEANNTSAEFTFTPNDDGDYVATVTITDKDDASTPVSSQVMTVSNANPGGTITGAPEGAIDEGDTVSLTAHPTDAGPADVTFSYVWSVTRNDEPMLQPSSPAPSNQNFSFTPSDEGGYVVTVRITDKDGGFSDISTDPITVNNVAPTPSIGGLPSSGGDELTATLPQNTVDTIDANQNIFHNSGVLQVGEAGPGIMWASVMKWQLPEGLTIDQVDDAVLTLHIGAATQRTVDLYTFDSASPTITSTDYADLDAATTVIASDIFNGSSQTVEIQNRALVNAITDAITNDRDYVSFGIRVATNIPQQVIDVGWFYGPTSESTELQPTLTIQTPGAATAVEGSTITLNASSTDPGADDTATYAWSVTKGSQPYELPEGTETDGETFSFVPDDNGSYTVTLTATDNDGDHNSTTADITVSNANPTGTVITPESGSEGSPLTFSVDASDPGAADREGLTYSWSVTRNTVAYELGEEVDTTGSSLTFTPNDDGDYVATVTITDKDDGSVELTSENVSVIDVTPTATFTGVPEEPVVEGTQLTVTAHVTDPGVNDTFTFEWHYYKNDGENMVETDMPPDAVVDGDTVTFTATDNGLYGWYVYVTDNATATSLNQSPFFTVTNANPTGEISGQPEGDVNEGSTVELSVTPADAGAEDTTFLYSWFVTKGEEEFVLPEETDTSSADFSFIPTDDGTYVATVKITDKDGGHSEVSTDPITVVNVDPTATLSRDDEEANVEGTPITFTANPSDAGALDTFTYTWSVTKDDAELDLGEEPNNTSQQFSFTPPDDGEYVVTCVIHDNNEGSVSVSSDPITVDNADPVASITGTPEESVAEGTEVTLTAGQTDPGSADTFSYLWSVTKDENGYTLPHTVATDGQTFTFAPDDQGEYVVTLLVTDNNGGENSTTATFTVTNADPTGTIDGEPEGSIVEGTPVSLTVTAADPGARDTFTYSWSLTKDDAPFTLPEEAITSNATFNFTPADNGSYVATVTITDKDDAHTDVSTGAITVTNANPTGTISGEPQSSIAEGTAVTLTAHPSDVGVLDTFTYAWSVKNGEVAYTLPNNTVTNAAGFTFTPRDNGSYVATVTITDKDSGHVDVSSHTITVTNVDPTATLTGPSSLSVTEGTQVELGVTASDAGADDTLTYAWSVTKGEAAYILPNGVVTNNSAFAFTPSDQGSYVVTCIISDDDSGSVTKHSSTITVTNVAPTAIVSTNAITVRGRTMTVNATISDHGSGDTSSISWDWGDGSPVDTLTAGSATVLHREHIYATAGNYTVTITGQDNNGGVMTPATTLVTSKIAAILPDPMDPDKTALVVGGSPQDDVEKFTLTENGSIKLSSTLGS